MAKFFGDRMEKWYTKYCPRCHSKDVDPDVRNKYGEIWFVCKNCGFKYLREVKSWGVERRKGVR